MSTVAAPYGFRPINHIGGTPYAGAIRQIPIASGYATNIFNGTVVSIVGAGTIQIVTAVGSSGDPFPAGVVGVFVGCSFTTTATGFVHSQYWPTGTVASDAMAYIVDDPNALFMVQAAGAVTDNDLGQNCGLNSVQSTSTGSTATGNSNIAMNATTNTVAQSAFRIVDFVRGPTSAPGDAFTDLVVKFNAGIHAYNNATGI